MNQSANDWSMKSVKKRMAIGYNFKWSIETMKNIHKTFTKIFYWEWKK